MTLSLNPNLDRTDILKFSVVDQPLMATERYPRAADLRPVAVFSRKEFASAPDICMMLHGIARLTTHIL